MKPIACRNYLVILALLFAAFVGTNCSDSATMTAGGPNLSTQDDKDVADTGQAEDTSSPDTQAPEPEPDASTPEPEPDAQTPEPDAQTPEPDAQTPEPDAQTPEPDTGAPPACTNSDLSGCSAPANAHTVGCTLGSCSFECDAGYNDLNQDLGQSASDGCEYACTPSNNGIEICDGLDNNCDGEVDEGLSGTYYRDGDGDGYGKMDDSVQGCDATNYYTTEIAGDCNDNNASVYPGAPILECVSDVDYNCSGETSCNDSACLGEVCHADGITVCTSGRFKCLPEVIADPGPADPICFPTNGGVEICDGRDNDCNGSVDDGLTGRHYKDSDGDGYGISGNTVMGCDLANHYTATQGGDCNDNNADVYPDAPILECTTDVDYNCNQKTSCRDSGCAGEACGSGTCQGNYCVLSSDPVPL